MIWRVVCHHFLLWLSYYLLFEGQNVTRIPGKPHESGLMLYHLGTYSAKLGQKPYICAMLPHWGIKKPTPLDAAKQLLELYHRFYKQAPHCVLGMLESCISIKFQDARFMDSEFIDWVEQYAFNSNGGATVALPKSHMKSLFGLLSDGVTEGQWRSAYTQHGKVVLNSVQN